MKEMKKRGLSDVITTVLIILLVLAAVAIIATYVIQFAQKGGEQIGGSAACTALQVQPEKCAYNINSAKDNANPPADIPNDDSLSITASKKGSDAKITKIAVILEKPDGTTESKDATTIPGYQETKEVLKDIGLQGKVYSKVSLAATVETTSGELSPCGESRKIVCS